MHKRKCRFWANFLGPKFAPFGQSVKACSHPHELAIWEIDSTNCVKMKLNLHGNWFPFHVWCG